MVLKKILPLLMLALALPNFCSPAQVLNLNGKEPFVQGEILVRFKDEASPENRSKAADLVGVSQSLHHPTLFKIKLKPGLGVQEALDKVKNDPSVKYAQPNYRYYALSVCPLPTDTYSTGSYDWPFLKIQADKAWQLFQSPSCPPGSSSVTVAVLDSGVSRAHPDLVNVPPIGYNAICDVQGQAPSCSCGSSVTDFGGTFASNDDFGHGTYVAGIINAEWNTTRSESGSCNFTLTSGMAGMAPGITLMAVKVLDCTGSGTTSSIVMGTNYAVSHGARILNFSLGSPGSDGLDPAEQEALDNALANNCVVVAASGNESRPGQLAPVDYPAAYPPVLAVGATDSNDKRAFYSNGGANLDLVAPGGSGTGIYNPNSDIFSSFLCPLSAAALSEGGFFPLSTDSNFGTAAGTSAATPFVSGAAALIWSFYPNLTNTQVVQAIVNNTDSLNGNQGWNPQAGYGRLNIYRALLNAGNGGGQVTSYLTTFNSPNPFYTSVTGTTNITISITQAAPVELTIYDSSGEVVLHKNYDPGQLNNNLSNPQFKSFYIPWDGKNGLGQAVVTGIYFYTVKVNGQVGRNKIALIQGGK